MPLKYKDAIYYRQGVGAFTTGYRCKRRKLGCNGMVKFPVSNTHPDRPVTSELLEFRPHADGCEFFESNSKLRKVAQKELDPYINKSGQQISNEWRTVFMKRSPNRAATRDRTTGGQITGDRTRDAASRLTGAGFREREGDRSDEDHRWLAEEAEAKRIDGEESMFSGGTVTNSAHRRTGDHYGLVHSEEDLINETSESKLDELGEAIKTADRCLEHLEHCLRDFFVTTCDHLSADESDEDLQDLSW